MSKYCIIGTGRQGTAALYDIILYGHPSSILLVDSNQSFLKTCFEKIKNVLNDNVSIKCEVADINNNDLIIKLLKPCDIFLSSVPYQYNPMLTDIAIKSQTSMVDLGGHTHNVIKQLKYHEKAINCGISIVPDCGMGPGMNISMALLAMEHLDNPEDVYIWDGGLPQNPIPPWNYSLFFNIKGLTNEYDGNAYFLKDGIVTEVSCFEGYEELEFDNIGKLEAVVTSGGLSTMPWTFENILNTLENKTLRYEGHWQLMKAYRQLGLFSENEIIYNGNKIIPRDFYHHLLEPILNSNDNNDICIMRTEAFGTNNENKAAFRFEVIEKYDSKTGFMAMEKWTGWHASIVMQKIVEGVIKPGAYPIEKALSGKEFYKQALKRGYKIKKTKLI